MLRKVLFQLHWLIGISAGIVLAIVGLTGAILGLEQPVTDYLNRDARRVIAAQSAPLSPADLLRRASEQQPGRRILSLQIASDPSAAARITLAPQQALQRGSPPRPETRYVNPYTGEFISALGQRGEAFFRSVMQLHRWLLANTWGQQAVGKHIVGAATVLCVVLLLSGLYLRWPRRMNDWRAWLRLDFSLKGKAFLWNLHAVIGTWLLLMYLCMSLTGLQWSYEWYRRGLYTIAGVDLPKPGARDMQARGNTSQDIRVLTDQVARAWQIFQESTPQGFRSATVSLPPTAERPLEIRYLDAHAAHDRDYNKLSIDLKSGTSTHERYAEKSLGGKFIASIFALHTGSFFGWPGRIAFIVASVSMPLFAITGWMLYLQRRRARALAQSRKRVLAAQGATSAS